MASVRVELRMVTAELVVLLLALLAFMAERSMPRASRWRSWVSDAAWALLAAAVTGWLL